MARSISASDEEAVASGSKGPLSTDTSILTHLAELAAKLRKSIIAYVIALAAVSSLPNPAQPFGGPASVFGYDFLLLVLIRHAGQVYIGSNYKFFAESPTDPIFAFVNVSMVLALVISLPYIFHQMYSFVAPGLYNKERRAIRKYVIPFAALLTVGGIFGLLVVLPTVIRILLLFYQPFNLAPLISLDDFVNLLLLIPFATGLAFTFPVFVIPLVELKVIRVEQLTSARKWVYVLVALGVGIIDPDPTFLSAIPIILPIYILFEATVFISKRIEREMERQRLRNDLTRMA